MLARSLLLNVAGSLQFISQSRLKPITQYRVTVLAVPKSAEQVLEYRWRALSFCEPPSQFILVSKRNTPGVWLRSTRLFEGRCAPVLSKLRFDDDFGAGGDARRHHHPRRHA